MTSTVPSASLPADLPPLEPLAAGSALPTGSQHQHGDLSQTQRHSHGTSHGQGHSHGSGNLASSSSYPQTEYHGPLPPSRLHAHSHGGHSHTHGNADDDDEAAGHSHTHPDAPGRFSDREPIDKYETHRRYEERAFTIGIGGPVGSGKTALTLSLCRLLRDRYNVVVVTNDIFTKEDCEFLTKHDALTPADRIRAVETGGCPHGAIREDCSANLAMVEMLTHQYRPDFCLLEAGGDNLAANFSRELADYIIYVIDVAGGDKIPRKGGPGITQADLLVVNKTDLASAVGADLELMRVQGEAMRDGGPIVFAQVKHMKGVEEIATHFVDVWKRSTGRVK